MIVLLHNRHACSSVNVTYVYHIVRCVINFASGNFVRTIEARQRTHPLTQYNGTGKRDEKKAIRTAHMYTVHAEGNRTNRMQSEEHVSKKGIEMYTECRRKQFVFCWRK